MDNWLNVLDTPECKGNPCENGGICQDEVDGYLCMCAVSFGGINCEQGECKDACKGVVL